MPLPSFNPESQVFAEGSDGRLRVIEKGQEAQQVAAGGRVLDLSEGIARYQAAEKKQAAESLRGQAETLSSSVVSGALALPAALAGGTGEQAAAGIFGAANESLYGQDTTLGIHDQMRVNAEANPTLQLLGSTIGNTATAMVGGMGAGAVGGKLATALGSEALAANLATGGTLSQLAGRAVTAAPGVVGTLAENAAGGIAAANEQAFLENHELAADEVAGAGLIGAGLGFGIGQAARGLGIAADKAGSLARRAVPEGVMQRVADKAAFRDMASGAAKRIFKGVDEKEAGEIGNRLLREGITGKSAQEAADLLSGKLTQAGEKKRVIEAMASGHFDSDSLLAKMRAHADELGQTPTPEARALAKRVSDQADQLEEHFRAAKTGIDKNALDGAMAARKSIGQQLEKFEDPLMRDKPAAQAYRRMYGEIAGALDDAVTKADDALGGGGGLSSEWKGLNKEYGQLKTASNAYKSRIAKEESEAIFSQGEQHSGGQAALLGSLMTGNLGTGALLGIGTGMARKLVSEKGAGWVARAANHLAQGGEVPSVTKLLALSSQARQGLAKHAVGQMVQQGARRITAAAEEAPAGFAFGALANYSNPKNVASQYAAVTRQIDASGSDLEGMASRATEHLGALAHEQPELAAAAQMKMARAVDYLRDNMPPSPPQSVLATAAGNASAKLPPSFEQVSWLKRYRATVDPSVVYGEIARGHINPETVQTLQTLYPAYLASVQMGTLEALNAVPGTIAKLPYSKRLALDTLMGSTGQVEPTRRFTVQDRLAQANAEVTQAAGPQAPASRKAPDIAQFGVTTSARLMST